MANRLASATSPYLLQHAGNPVDWWEWGDDAFEEARRRDTPILLSVGYAACHWCHVMAHESFEDAELAAYLNERFVAVKVDREERPDVDAVYMESVQALTGQGGWPMTVFLTPAGAPFYAGTYFPPQPRQGLPSFRQLLEAVADAWSGRRGEVTETAAKIAGALGRSVLTSTGAAPTRAQLDSAVDRLSAEFDQSAGGFGSAPKFPPSMVLEFLLRHHARTGDPRALSMVGKTCEQMARGGIYDQLGGGFARYSVDREWVVPHFEKMLFDNALLLRVYLHWWRASQSPLAERIVRETANFLLRELRTGEGGFASSLDADSPTADGERSAEGAFYVWTPAQLREVLGEEGGRWAADAFGVTDTGTFEQGSSTLRLPAGLDADERFADVRRRLFEARSLRPNPGRDDKIVVAWNGLAIAALAEAGAVFEEPGWIGAAVDAAELLLRLHVDEAGKLHRVSRGGLVAQPPGVLEDYAGLTEGLLALVAATGEPRWLTAAERLLETVLTSFTDGGGGFFDTGADTTDVRLAGLRRPQDPTDNATPSGWSATAGALLTYAAYTGSTSHRQAAEAALGIYAELADRAPRFAGWGLAVSEAAAAGPVEVAIVGPREDTGTTALRLAALRHPSAGAAIVAGDPIDEAAMESIPLLRDRGLVDGSPAAYVCRHFVCDRPASEVAELISQLSAR